MVWIFAVTSLFWERRAPPGYECCSVHLRAAVCLEDIFAILLVRDPDEGVAVFLSRDLCCVGVALARAERLYAPSGIMLQALAVVFGLQAV